MAFLRTFTTGFLAAALASTIVSAASAQTAGVYNGTSTDQQPISLTVATDANGALAITSVSVGINATCKPGGSPFATGWGYGQDAVITNSAFSYVESFAYLYEPVKGSFNGNTITGTISSDLPTFAPVMQGAPKKSVFCKSAKQAFTATLGAAAKRTAPVAATYSLLR